LKPLGSLEERVMALLWEGEPMSVREVNTRLGARLAHTTTMTTLDRLFKKGLLVRQKHGAAYIYRAAISQDEFHQRLLENTVGDLLQKSTGPVLAAFVDTAAELDEENLARLEALIAKRRGGAK